MSTSTLELAEILDAIAESIVVLNPDGGIFYANRAVLEYTGLSMPDVLAGDFLSRLFHPRTSSGSRIPGVSDCLTACL